MRGQQKCIVMVQNKHEEDTIVPPDFFKQAFQDIGVSHGASITLHEVKNWNDFEQDGDEGGEDENEEMEAEQEEEQNPEEEDPKAAEVLFENDEASKKEESKNGSQWVVNLHQHILN